VRSPRPKTFRRSLLRRFGRWFCGRTEASPPPLVHCNPGTIASSTGSGFLLFGLAELFRNAVRHVTNSFDRSRILLANHGLLHVDFEILVKGESPEVAAANPVASGASTPSARMLRCVRWNPSHSPPFGSVERSSLDRITPERACPYGQTRWIRGPHRSRQETVGMSRD
jgi:hypothetical protein